MSYHNNGEEDKHEPGENDEFEPELPPAKHGPKPIAIIGIIIAALLVIGGGAAAVRTFGGSVIGPSPTPTPTLIPGENLYYITTNPRWGTITIDGRQVSHLPAIGSTPLQLSPGEHEVVWNVAPFISQKCFVSVPPQENTGSSYCSTGDTAAVRSGKYTGLQATIVEFTPSLSMLPDAQRALLIQAIQAQLDTFQATDTVQPGEQFADLQAPHFIQTATQPLKAAIHFQLDTNPNSPAPCPGSDAASGSGCRVNGEDCHLLCPLPLSEARLASSTSWQVYGVLQAFWDYTTLSGQRVAQNQPDEADNVGNEYLIPLVITWDGSRWHVDLQSYQISSLFSFTAIPPCVAMQAGFISDSYPNAVTINGNNDGIYWSYSAGTNSASGCLAKGPLFVGNTTTPVPSTSAPTAYLLYRFGVLLAVTAAAHHYWPSLPVADAYEQGIARKLGASL